MLNQTHLNKLIAHLETRAAGPGMGVTTRHWIMSGDRTGTPVGPCGCIAWENAQMEGLPGNEDFIFWLLQRNLEIPLNKSLLLFVNTYYWKPEWKEKWLHDPAIQTLRDELTVMADYLKTFREEISLTSVDENVGVTL